jgi:hypothetical protein
MFTNYTITRKCWRGIEIEIRWEASAIIYEDGQILGHLEIEAIAPQRAKLPVSDTGYRSHFVDAKTVTAAGGAAAFVEAWFDELAAPKCWHKPVRRSPINPIGVQQLSLL